MRACARARAIGEYVFRTSPHRRSPEGSLWRPSAVGARGPRLRDSVRAEPEEMMTAAECRLASAAPSLVLRVTPLLRAADEGPGGRGRCRAALRARAWPEGERLRRRRRRRRSRGAPPPSRVRLRRRRAGLAHAGAHGHRGRRRGEEPGRPDTHPHADRPRRPVGPGGRPQRRCRRLPGEAVRLLRAGGPDPCPATPSAAGVGPGAGVRRPAVRSRHPRGHGGRANRSG